MLPGKHDQVDGPYMLLLKWYYFSSYTHEKNSIRQIENFIFWL